MGERITVLYFSNAMARGGVEEHILTLIRGLDRSRFRPLLACPPDVAGELAVDLPHDVEPVALMLRKPNDIGPAMALARLIRRERVDVLHSHQFYSSLFASPIGWLCRVPFIVETPHVRERWRHGLKAHYAIDRLVGRFVNQYISVSEANRRYLIHEKGLPPDKVVVIHNGCDVQRFVPSSGNASELRQTLGIAQSDPVLLVVGRLEPQKGHRVLLDALPAIRRRHFKTKLVCVGEGSLHRELAERVAADGLQGIAHFVGQQSNVADWLGLADVVVLPSFYEGLPLAAIESLAAGRAIVASAVDGTPEVVIDGITGLTVPPGDPTALAGAVCRLLDDPELRKRLATRGRELVVERFAEQRQVQRTEALYQMGLMGRGRWFRSTAELATQRDHR